MVPHQGFGGGPKSGIGRDVRYMAARKQAPNYARPNDIDIESVQSETTEMTEPTETTEATFDDYGWDEYGHNDDDVVMSDDDSELALEETMKQFASMVGKVKTFNQVSAASHWMTSMQCTHKDILKFRASHMHAENVGLQVFWPEIIIYGAIGQISTYFLSGQDLRKGGPSNINALDELEVSVVGWVWLASEGRLSRMEQFAHVVDGEGRYDSNAERFKAFLVQYKSQGGFKKWDHNRMKMLRYKIYKVVHELDGEEQRPMLPSDPRQARLSLAREAVAGLGRALSQGSRTRSVSTRSRRSTAQTSRASTFDHVYSRGGTPRENSFVAVARGALQG